MRFFYVINNNKQLIDVGKIDSAKGYLMQRLTCDFGKMGLEKNKRHLITIDIKEVKELIDDLLLERNSKPLDIPDYKGRFLESEVFMNKDFEGVNLKLCNTGFDHQIIFLINIYNSLLKNESPYYIVFADTHKDFEEFQKERVK